MNRRTQAAAAVLLVGFLTAAAHARTPGLSRDVVFDHPSALTQNRTIATRMLTPLLAEAANRRLDAVAGASELFAIDLAQERFELHVPPGEAPAAGFGLLVFVPPWETQGLPRDWIAVLERAGMIAVVAGRSGNAQNVLGRRVPLALAAYDNLRRTHRIDPARVFVGGFSGGARVALRLALAFPDIFRGALLNAGSDPLGSPGVPLPEAALFARFERDTRLVFTSGTRDTAVADMDRRSAASARELCVSNLVELPIRGGGHEPADARTFARALRELDAPRSERRGAETCRSARAAEIAHHLDAIGAQIDAGRLDAAARALGELDTHFGGLAAPRSLELAARLRDRGVEPPGLR